MKTNRSLRIFKLSTLAPLGIAAAAALSPAYANSNLNITEISSTSLSATYDGSTSGVTVTPGAVADTWTVTVSSVMFRQFGVNWLEPEHSRLENFVVDAVGINPHVLDINSDSTAGSSLNSFPNGTRLIGLGRDTVTGAGVNITFFDSRDVTHVPDTGSTFGLLFVSLIALLSATRLRSVRLT